MTTVLIDIETYSSVDIAKCGNYKYTESEDFAVLLFSYSIDDAPALLVDIASGEEIPEEIRHACYDPDVLKLAHNMVFEITALSKYFGVPLDPTQWQDTMALGAYLGLPLSLAQVGEVLNLSEKKSASGTRLIRMFSVPNAKGYRVFPEEKPEQWEEFKKYCLQDVDTETALYKKVRNRVPVPSWERELQMADFRINKRGVRIDLTLARNAVAFWSKTEESLIEEMKKITGLDNPNSLAQLKLWLAGWGVKVDSLNKLALADLLNKSSVPEKVKRVLQIRKELGKTSVKKYEAMLNCACSDGRAHGITQYYGTTTGRWCLTPDHEVLTPSGWVRIDEWSGGEIACCNPTFGSISFQKAERVCFDYSGVMYHTESQRIDQICTPEHKMAYKTKMGNWESATIEKLSKHRFSMPLSLTRRVSIGNDSVLLRVLVMTQADGYYTPEGVKYHFKKYRKVVRCKTLLRKAEIPFVQKSNSDGTTVIYVARRVMPIWLRMFSNKTFGSWVFNENADAFFDELDFWDGYRCGPNSSQYITINKTNADLVQTFAVLSGRSATIIIKKARNENWADSYVVNVWHTAPQSHDVRIEYTTKENYTGEVYCASTTTGFFLVRRNGKVWTTGNSGRGIQTQNLPQNHIEDLDYARQLLASGDYYGMDMAYDSISDTLSQLIRTALIPSEGNIFHVCDFSAIECRVLAWLASEKWVLDAFMEGKDIYCATASMMYGVPVEKHGKNADLRQKGKRAVLGCIAEGQLVETDKGLIPIQHVTTDMKVWDGENWVTHEGVIYKGIKDVIEYEGLTATPDHLVFVEGEKGAIQLGDAASCGSHLLQSRNSGENIWPCRDNIARKEVDEGLASRYGSHKMSRLWRYSMDTIREFNSRIIKRMPVLFSAKTNTGLVGQKDNSTKTEMRKSKRQKFQALWGAWNKIQFQECNGGWALFDALISKYRPKSRNRQNRQQRELRARECSNGDKKRKYCEQKHNSSFRIQSSVLALHGKSSEREIIKGANERTNNCAGSKSCKREEKMLATYKGKARVYDIRNAGAHHRYAVSGKIVHNCGYGGGVGALRAMGAERDGLNEEAMKEVVKAWRKANPNIVAFWNLVGRAAVATIITGQEHTVNDKITFSSHYGFLFVTLPSGRSIAYPRAKVIECGPGDFNIEYERINQETRKWQRTQTFAGKLVENVTQAVARDILGAVILRCEAANLPIVFHVHDEVIVDCPKDRSLEEVERLFSEPIPWAPGLPLKGAGYTTKYYMKD